MARLGHLRRARLRVVGRRGRSSTTIWPTTPSIHRCSRCWPHCRCWRSIRSCRATGTGSSTTNARTAPASSRRRCAPAPCTGSHSPPGSCRCSECALLALALYGLASLLFGPAAGVVAALLWLLDPLVLGLGHLDGVDLPFALTTVLVSWAMVRWLRRRDRRSLALAGGGLRGGGLGPGHRTAARCLAVAVVLAAGIRRGRRGLAPAGANRVVVVLTAWVLVWAVYIVLDPGVVVHSCVPRSAALRGGPEVPGHPRHGGLTRLPARGVVDGGQCLVLARHAGGQGVDSGPRPAGGRTGRAGRPGSDGKGQPVDVAPDRGRRGVPALVLFVFELPNPRTLGVRYLLPSIALWIVACVADRPGVSRRLVALALGLVLAAAAAVTVSSYPHSIAYTAPPFRPGYRVATDSNVDWGQDFSLLVAWSRGRHPYVAYFGPRGISEGGYRRGPATGGRRAGHASRVGWPRRPATSPARTADSLAGCGPTAPWARWAAPSSCTTSPSRRRRQPGPSAPAPLCAGQASRRVSVRCRVASGVPLRIGDAERQARTLRRKLRSPRVKKTALKARSAG